MRIHSLPTTVLPTIPTREIDMPKTTKKAEPKKTGGKPKKDSYVPETVVEAKVLPEIAPTYPNLEITEYSTASKQGPLTPEDAKVMLWWETEKEYQKRMLELYPDSKPESWVFGEAGPKREDTGQIQPIHCLNTKGEKVVCWNNANNRPFDNSWREDLTHTILSGQWAGPLTIPGETINGETVRISRYARVLSGQHQLTALILADEELEKDRQRATYNPLFPKYPFWSGKKCPVIETIVVTGLSEDERVLRTIDYVKPRSTADMLYTMEIFRDCVPVARKEMTRMLSSAIDLLWQRTDTKGYMTHPEVVGFLERHKRLLRCVEHLFKINSKDSGPEGGRRISKLHLSAGQCAALCYLMGCGTEKTTQYSDEYRNETPPSEKNLDWSYWDKAQEFWTNLASDHSFVPVRHALGQLVVSAPSSEENQGLGGRTEEKFAIICKAWEVYRDHKKTHGPPFSTEDLEDGGVLCLCYSDLDKDSKKLPDGMVMLVDIADFEGIDCPEVRKTKTNAKAAPTPPPPTPAEIEKLAEEARARREEKRDELLNRRKKK